MLQCKNTQVAFLMRALNAVSNSYSVGEIDTRSRLSVQDFYTLPISKKVAELLREEFDKYATAKKLACNVEPHQSHDSFLKEIIVTVDIKYPLYWSSEFQRYHFAEIIMSQSTMHSLKSLLMVTYIRLTSM